ncbi:hypothetical protein FJT64_019377 [Amphibalanus amphitrite]|uniref:Uncharacterized protein n=1 Tax=Amphibalanus amphitrite TaxID=1232801 RepID=A0A6A4WU45_AMPAM|nr:hypothetical protein FJT64_019377 [Amphibalanus amphitrite]
MLLSSRLQQLLQRSNDLDRLQASLAGGGGDCPPLAAANGQRRPLPPVAAAPPHLVSAIGDGLVLKTASQRPAGARSPAVTVSASSHQKILPKPVLQSAAAADPPNYKVEKVKNRHKGAKAAGAARARPDSAPPKFKVRPSISVPAEARPDHRLGGTGAPGARSRARPSSLPTPAAARLPRLPAELRAYQLLSEQEEAARRPLLPAPAAGSEPESSDWEPAPAAAERYRERRRFSRCRRLLVEQMRSSGGAAAARLCGRLLRPPPGAADTERGRRLRARQRLEARRLLAALEEARDRRRQRHERARLTSLLLGAAAAYPSRTGQLLQPQRPADAHTR